MRSACTAIVAITLISGGAVAVRAADASARDLLDKSMKAMGGDEKLAKLATGIARTKGKIINNDVEVTFTDEWYLRAADKFRVDLDVDIKGQSLKASFVLKGAVGWLKATNAVKTEELPKEIIAAIREGADAARVPHRLATLKDKDAELSPLGELKIGDRDTIGLRVIRKGRPDLAIFFDKITSLPVKSEIRLSEGQGQELCYEFFFEDYKDFDGLKQFSKITFKRDGKVFLESEVVELKPGATLDDTLFEKP